MNFLWIFTEKALFYKRFTPLKPRRTHEQQAVAMVASHRNLIAISLQNYDSIGRLRTPGYWNAASNRLYYAVFQLLYVGLFEKDKVKSDEASIHDAVGRVVEEEYGHEISDLFHDLKRLRVDADYKGVFIGEERFEQMKSQADLKYDEIKRRVTA